MLASEMDLSGLSFVYVEYTQSCNEVFAHMLGYMLLRIDYSQNFIFRFSLSLSASEIP